MNPTDAEVFVPYDGTFELKFVLPETLADRLLAVARSHLAPDPHAEASLGDGYRVQSLYFDTAAFDTYHGLGSHRRVKYRLRRYGAETRIFLERKSKTRELVRKRRTVIAETDLARLETATTDRDWPGIWYQRRLLRRGLAPTSQIAYQRIARIGATPDGPIRLTVDQRLRCGPAVGMYFETLSNGREILPNQAIVEFKYHIALPALFKSLICEFALAPEGISKYRCSVDACGLVARADAESKAMESTRAGAHCLAERGPQDA